MSYYGLSDGCDCDCGTWDPDCDDADATVWGCSGGACEKNDDGEGVCAGDYDYGNDNWWLNYDYDYDYD